MGNTGIASTIYCNGMYAIANTVKIAERCNVSFEFGNTKLPNFTAPTGESNRDYFYRLCFEGLYRNYGNDVDKEFAKKLLIEKFNSLYRT